MVPFERFELNNGLRVLVHEDQSTPMVAVNVLYNVGARDERPDRTGFAHLFEHLMFGGSANVPDFDEAIQQAGGENNAFTNNDITNFYDILPAQNIETAFWLESDRMLSLNFDERVLEVQRKVVLEEFNETCFNEPYGDVWHHIADMAYKVHPYRWPTIGKVPQHVAEATLDDVQDFFYKYYRPNNAILVVAGNTTRTEVERLSKKWFGDIEPGLIPERFLPQEPAQDKLQQRINRANVPVDALYLAFHSPGRLDPLYYAADLLTDILGYGASARLQRALLHQQGLVSDVDCYLTGSIDPGLLIVEGRPATGISLQQVEEAIWSILHEVRHHPVGEEELQKWKNKVESNLLFSETNILNKAINLAYFEVLGQPDLINQEIEFYRQVTVDDIQEAARRILIPENCSELYYESAPSANARRHFA